MGTMIITYKIMPESPEFDLNEVKGKVDEIIASFGGKGGDSKTEPVGFGLSSLKIMFSVDESVSLDDIEDKIKELEEVSNVEVIDMRRALG